MPHRAEADFHRASIEIGDRPDPDQLPARYRVRLGDEDDEGFAVVLHRERAIIRRRIAGLPMTMAVPIASFRGIAVWIGDELEAMEFSLAHDDPALSVPLGQVADVDEAARTWKRWAEVLSLPLVVLEPDGSLRPVDRGEVEPTPPPADAPERLVRAFVVHQGGRTTMSPE